MAKWKVKVRMSQIYEKDIEVEADSLDEAKTQVLDSIDEGHVSFDDSDTIDYEHEVPVESMQLLDPHKVYEYHELCNTCYSRPGVIGVYPTAVCASCASGPVIIPPSDPVDPNEITIDLNLHNIDPKDLLMPTETPPSDPNWRMIPDYDYYWKQLGQCPSCKDGTKPVSQPGGGFSCPKCKWSLG